MEQMDDDHDNGDGHGDDQVLKLGEKKKEKNKMAQGKGIFDRSILFCHSRHQVGVSGFRIDIRTIKRGKTHCEMRLSKCH
jgi:hypothetical protein